MSAERRPVIHALKCWSEPFEALRSGVKRFEYRRDDRVPRFEVGDGLQISEWDPFLQEHSGQSLAFRVTYLIRGPEYGVPAGFVVMSISIEGG